MAIHRYRLAAGDVMHAAGRCLPVHARAALICLSDFLLRLPMSGDVPPVASASAASDSAKNVARSRNRFRSRSRGAFAKNRVS
jgi:hypothetical protein